MKLYSVFIKILETHNIPQNFCVYEVSYFFADFITLFSYNCLIDPVVQNVINLFFFKFAQKQITFTRKWWHKSPSRTLDDIAALPYHVLHYLSLKDRVTKLCIGQMAASDVKVSCAELVMAKSGKYDILFEIA